MENCIPKSVKIQLYVTRHGQTEQNKNKTLCGQQPGKLTKQGIEQAQKIGVFLKNKNFSKIYVSDLKRTRDTFQNIALKAPHLKNVEIKYESLIRQKNAGVLAGQSRSAWEIQALKQKKNIREYKCKDGQSWNDVNKRIHKFIEKLMLQNVLNQKNPQMQQQILIVCHGGCIMEFHNACRTINSKGKQQPLYENSAKNCSIHIFQLEYPLETETKEYNQDLLSFRCILNNFTRHMED